MAKSKAPTPQEIYRQRKQREENEKSAYLPPGLINHGNTCFMNSVLQGLIATRLLADLVFFNPIPPEVQATSSTAIVSRRSPQLTNGHNLAGSYEQPWVNTMPIGDMFLTVMYKAWTSQSARKREILSPKPILGALGQKYDQYLDFAQQDAHEFLRILLDAMRMEEQDIIKKRQPPPTHKKRRRTTITPANFRDSGNTQNSPDPEPPLLSFADMIFGGQLTSILVCQKCKHVSQTYEEFNDISLSIKAEDYAHNRKRDRFKKMVGRLTQFPGTSSQSKEPEKVPLHLPLVPPHAVEMLRASSVPPSPRTERDVAQLARDDPPTVNPSRRRSLDLHVGQAESDPDSQESLPPPATLEIPEEKPSTDRDDVTLESENSHVLVNLTTPDDKHVEFVEPELLRKEKHDSAPVSGSDKDKDKPSKYEDNGWAKIGRRISLSVGLGRPRGVDKDKEKDRKERDRKSRSVDRAHLGVPESIKEAAVANPGMQKSVSASAGVSSTVSSPVIDPVPTKSRVASESAVPSSSPALATASASSSLSIRAPKPIQPRPTFSNTSIPNIVRSSSPRPSSTQPTLLTAEPNAASSSTSVFPNVQRSKSPKPPKPSAAETEYLRKILADVATAPASNNPFAIFKPPMLHSTSSLHNTRTALAGLAGVGDTSTAGGSSSDKAGATWLGPLGIGARNFSGVEECLRMFTAVEVLDGENMVGCRRCWKIQNGMYHTSKGKDSDQDDDEEEDEDESRQDAKPQARVADDSVFADDVNGDLSAHKPRPSLQPLATSHTTTTGTHIPTSISTPTVSFYSQSNTSDTRSVSSLPLENTAMSETGEDSPRSLSAISESSWKGDPSATPQHGPFGFTIPVISTTAPDTPTSSSVYVSSRSSIVAESLDETDGTSVAPPSASVPSPHPRLTQALYGYNPSHAGESKDSLVIPPRMPRFSRRTTSSDTTRTDDSSDDQSDTSIETSVSADSVASREPENERSRSQQNQASAGATSLSPSMTSQQQLTAAPAAPRQKKASKPKPVIMRPAYKRYLIATPPPVLVIHLKRFQQTSKTPLMSFSHGFKKLDDYVSFPEYLDLMPFLAPKKEDYGLGKKSKDKERKSHQKVERCMYRLYAVVVHIGNMLGGHYISYTALPAASSVASTADKTNSSSQTTSSTAPSTSDKAGVDNEGAESSTSDSKPIKPTERQWAYISDTVVRLTTLEEVLNAKAYICMYERC